MKLWLKIVGLLAKNTGSGLTINEIAKTLDEHYSFVHRTVDDLCRDAVITKKTVGNSHLCSLNLENEKTFALIQLGEIEKRDEFYGANKELGLMLEDFVKSARSRLDIVAIVLLGSYAKGTAAGGSDFDILVISRGRAGVDKITKEIYAKYGRVIAPIIMAPGEFRKQRGRAAIREIAENHYVLYGAENFVNLMFR